MKIRNRAGYNFSLNFSDFDVIDKINSSGFETTTNFEFLASQISNFLSDLCILGLKLTKGPLSTEKCQNGEIQVNGCSAALIQWRACFCDNLWDTKFRIEIAERATVIDQKQFYNTWTGSGVSRRSITVFNSPASQALRLLSGPETCMGNKTKILGSFTASFELQVSIFI